MRIVSAIFLGVLLVSAPAYAQTPVQAPPSAGGLLKVFLDCDECDSDYLKRTVTFVDYVRDRNVADVHVLVTTQDTGGGGSAWTVKFIGVGRFQDQDRTLTFTTSTIATADDRRKEFARIFRLGIVGYAASLSTTGQFDVTSSAAKGESQTTPGKDPWNYWVFRAGGGSSLNGQSLDKSSSYYGSVSASRTTEAWKINFSASRDENRSEFVVDSETTIVSRRSSWGVSGLVVKSLGPRWSLGARGSGLHSSFSNEDRTVQFMPGIEFDVFPYSESSQRSLTFQYNVGPVNYQYVEETIYGKIAETIPQHSLSMSLGLRQPWGSVGASANITQHLNHTDRYHIGLFGNADVRLFRGFSFNIFGDYSKIADQIGLPKSFLSTEEILLQTRQRPTNHSYYFSVGLSYQFGSIFNSTVNPRFGGSGGIFR
jgi:hypothetical protein